MELDTNRERIVRTLDAVDSVLRVFSRVVLAIGFIGLVALVALVIALRPFGNGNQGEMYYFLGAMAMTLLAIIAKFRALGQKGHGSAIQMLIRAIEVNGQARSKTWVMRIGGGPEAGAPGEAIPGGTWQFSTSGQLPAGILPVDIYPNEAAMERFAAAMERGLTFDEACEFVQPKFADWAEPERDAYRMVAWSLLSQRSAPTAAE